MSNEQKLREALRETLLFCETFSNRWDGETGAHPFGMVERARQALATTEPEPEPTGMPPAPEPDIHYIYIGLGWKPATAQQYAETHRQKCAMHSTIQLQTYGEQCWKAGYKHGAWGDKPSQEPQRHAYLDGVNVERLQCAMSIAGCAADPSIEGLAADLSGHVNRLTAAVANRAQTHKFTANCDQCAAERDNLRAQVELLTATQTPGALIGGGAPSQEPAVNQQLTTEPVDERAAFTDDTRDAARYRWLRDDTDSDWAICEWSHVPGDEGYYRDARAPHIVDAAIDAAMAQGVKG